MAINKVGSKGIEDGAIAAVDFADETVSSDKFANTTIENAKLSNSSITAAGSSISLGASVSFNNQFVDWQSKVTSDGSTVTTMESGKGYFIDNTSASGIVKLPASASAGDTVAIKDYAGNFGTNALVIQRNSHNIQGSANDSRLQTNRASVVLVYVDSTKGWLFSEESNVADLEKNLFISATGGTVTESGNFKIHTFTGDGNFVVSQIGAGTGPSVVDYLVIAGGGSGGSNKGGGGGAGGYREAKTGNNGCHTASPTATPTGITLTTQTYPITVGGGGAGGCHPNYNSGSNSVFSTITSAGGGAGGGKTSAVGSGKDGGSGGGGLGGYGGNPCGAAGGSGNTPPVSPPQGNNGGTGTPGCTSCDSGGGGGSAVAVGPNGNPGSGAGAPGGAGATSGIGGSNVQRAAGGGGAVRRGDGQPTGRSSGTGGSGGGGNGGGGPNPCAAGTAGSSNTGSGGGGGGPGSGGAAGGGGKGLVIIRYKFQ
jgi:hypothetical protein